MVPLVDNAHFSEETPDSRQNAAPAAPAKTAPEVHASAGTSAHSRSGAAERTASERACVRMAAGPQAAHPSRVYLRVDSADENCREFRKAVNLAEIFCDGMTDVIFYDKSKSAYVQA